MDEKTVWWAEALNLDKYLGTVKVPAPRAALLLAGHDPDTTSTKDAELTSRPEMTASDTKLLVECLSLEEPRRLHQWLAFARNNRLTVHPQVAAYLDATAPEKREPTQRVVDAELPSASTPAAQSERPMPIREQRMQKLREVMADMGYTAWPKETGGATESTKKKIRRECEKRYPRLFVPADTSERANTFNTAWKSLKAEWP